MNQFLTGILFLFVLTIWPPFTPNAEAEEECDEASNKLMTDLSQKLESITTSCSNLKDEKEANRLLRRCNKTDCTIASRELEKH